MLLRILVATGLAVSWICVCFVLLVATSETVAGASLCIGFLIIFYWFQNRFYARRFGWDEQERKTRELERFYRDQRKRLDELTNKSK